MIDYRKKYGKSAPAFEEAIDLLQKSPDPVEKLLNSGAYWIPMQFVYVEMVKNKEMTRLSDLPRHEKERLWDYVKGKDWPQWKKITLMQSIYVFEYLNKEGI